MRPSKCPLFKCPFLSAFNCPLTLAASLPASEQIRGDGITDEFFNRVPHGTRAELRVKTTAHQKRQNGFTWSQRVSLTASSAAVHSELFTKASLPHPLGQRLSNPEIFGGLLSDAF